MDRSGEVRCKGVIRMRTGDLWDEVMGLERRLDDLFRGMFAPKARTYFPALPAGLLRPFIPAVDVFKRDGDMVMTFELPGIDPETDVSVSVEESDLVISGERKHSEEIKEEDYYRMETSYGSFERRIALPEGVTEKDIKAEYHDGLLEVRVPAAKELKAPKAKAIPVKTTKAKAKKVA